MAIESQVAPVAVSSAPPNPSPSTSSAVSTITIDAQRWVNHGSPSKVRPVVRLRRTAASVASKPSDMPPKPSSAASTNGERRETPMEALARRGHEMVSAAPSVSPPPPVSEFTFRAREATKTLQSSVETPADVLAQRGREFASSRDDPAHAAAEASSVPVPAPANDSEPVDNETEPTYNPDSSKKEDATPSVDDLPTASRRISTATGRPHYFHQEKERAIASIHYAGAPRSREHLRQLQDLRYNYRPAPYDLISRGNGKKMTSVARLRLVIYGEEKDLGLFKARDRFRELEVEVWELSLALDASQKSRAELQQSLDAQQEILTSKEQELTQALSDLAEANRASQAVEEKRRLADQKAKEQAIIEKEAMVQIKAKLDKEKWARMTAEDTLKKVQEEQRLADLAESKRKVHDMARADEEAKKKKLEDERSAESRRVALLRVIEETRKDAEDKAAKTAKAAAEAHDKGKKRAREEGFAEGKRHALEEAAKKAKSAPPAPAPPDAEAEKMERARCASRDARFWPAELHPKWTPDVFFARFRHVCVEFDAIRFGPAQPLTLGSVPWPVLMAPKEFDPRKLQWDDVKAFFRYMPKAEYSRVLKECRVRYHPDKWHARFMTIADEALREQVRTAVINVSQSVGELISKDSKDKGSSA